MEEDPDLPADVLRFIRDRIDSVPHLETLLLLWESGDGAGRRPRWPVASMSRATRRAGCSSGSSSSGLIRSESAAAAAAGRFMSMTLPGTKRRALMPRVAATYRRQLVRVAKVIHAKAPPSVQEFARAFQLKKDP